MAKQGVEKERELSLRPSAEKPPEGPPISNHRAFGREETRKIPPPPAMVQMLDAEDTEGCHFIGPR